MLTITSLVKRTAEILFYNIDFSALLDATEVVSSVTSIQADQAGLTFGTPSINSVVIPYDDGTSAAIGTVVIVQISGGAIPAGQNSNKYTVRALVVTSTGNTREGTVTLVVSDEAVHTHN